MLNCSCNKINVLRCFLRVHISMLDMQKTTFDTLRCSNLFPRWIFSSLHNILICIMQPWDYSKSEYKAEAFFISMKRFIRRLNRHVHYMHFNQKQIKSEINWMSTESDWRTFCINRSECQVFRWSALDMYQAECSNMRWALNYSAIIRKVL